TFVSSSPGWLGAAGLKHGSRLQSDYFPLTTGSRTPTDYVRKDAVSAHQLAALRSYETQVMKPAAARRSAAPRRSCGPLIIGQPLA
ncbi:MAG: hypothetical protein ACRDRL_04865, partial [Sciscionella sp.]